MKKYFILFSLSLLLLNGCLQAKEHLTLNKDGTGTLEVEQLIPSGTIQLVDIMFGGMVKGMSEAFTPEGQEADIPESMAIEMFANKDQVIKKAEEAGVNIEFINFEHQMIGDDLKVNYAFKFDDINKVLKSELINSKLEFSKNSDDDLVISLKNDPNKVKKTEMGMAQMDGFKQSEGFKEMPLAMQNSMMSSMANFKAEISVTLPNEIIQVKGIFKKKDSYTAGFEAGGNIMDPETIKKLYAVGNEPPSIVCSSEGLSFLIDEKTEEVNQELFGSEYPVGSDICVYLKNGNSSQGILMEHTDEYLRVDVMGISITYYLEEIQKVELNLDKE